MELWVRRFRPDGKASGKWHMVMKVRVGAPDEFLEMNETGARTACKKWMPAETEDGRLTIVEVRPRGAMVDKKCRSLADDMAAS